MNELSFIELIDKYVVTIPMIQRDYAFGRIDEDEKREAFLKKLKSYFEDDKRHQLDFIYGSVNENNELILLDGQQRITTLFLLHWYLSLIKDCDGNNHFDDFSKHICDELGKSKFSYKTRFSSTDYCNIIASLNAYETSYVDEYTSFIESNNNIYISEKIKKEKWFLPNWNYDPTITSMLNMLDSITEFFKPNECRAYYNLLTEQRKITFNFLDLNEFNLTDELYIKMNSRGKPLTRFENLKSIILKLYDEAERENPDKYRAKLDMVNSTYGSGTDYRTLREYVARMIDTKWTDVFWNEWLNTPNHEAKPNIDNMMLSFISNLAIFEHFLFELANRISVSRSEKLPIEIYILMNEKDKEKGVTIKYERFIGIFRENDYSFLFNLIDYFNMFNDDGKLKKYLPESFEQYNENEAFRYLINDYKYGMEYERKVKLFAYIKYLFLNPNPNQSKFLSWMRFVYNVCSNSYTIKNASYTFCSAIAALNYLYDADIVSSLPQKDLTGITVLETDQINEEILKMLLSSNMEWKSAIDDAEKKLSYFEGRLRYPLIECSGTTNIDVENLQKLYTFNDYVDKMAAIFSSPSGCEFENELIRALISKGNYLMYFKSNNTFLKNDDRDNSWRNYLKAKHNPYHPFDKVDCDERDFFKAILDDALFDAKNAKESLKNIADSRSESIPMWRKLIIKHFDKISSEEYKSQGNDRNIRWNTEALSHKKDSEDNYEIDLIPGSAITGYHTELFSRCKYFEIINSPSTLATAIHYKWEKTSVAQPYFYLGENEENQLVKVFYQDNSCFRFIYNDGHEECNIPYDGVENKLQTYFQSSGLRLF